MTERDSLMKKIFTIMIAFLLLLCLYGNSAIGAAAEELPILSRMTSAEQIAFLERNGVEVPGGEVNYEYWSPFIKECIELVENDPAYMFRYNWTVSQDFSMAIQSAVNNYYRVTPNFSARLATREALTLIDNEILEPWTIDCIYYNCYAYAVGMTDRNYDAGDFSGHSYTSMPTLDTLATYVIQDLVSTSLGHTCVELYTSDSTAVISADTICVRLSPYDAHYMKWLVRYWAHKPGTSCILKYIGSVSVSRKWTDEGVYDGVVSRTEEKLYTGPIYYFTPVSEHVGYTISQIKQHYHSGAFHIYIVDQVCTSCGKTVEATIKKACSGPPCNVSLNVLAELDTQ